MTQTRLAELLKEIRACRVCETSLPLGPNPVLRASSTARLLVMGQAPGTRVHKTGIPWNDPSGDRLRDWLQLGPDEFYDTSRIAIVPMGFCYPGKGKSGDLPPRPECAGLWHARLLQCMPQLGLTLLIGQYAQRHYLRNSGRTLAETVRNRRLGPEKFFPLPHPSPRNRLWLKRNPWFEQEVLPELRVKVKGLLEKA